MAWRTIYDTIGMGLKLALLLGFFPTYLSKVGRKVVIKTNRWCTVITIFYFILFGIMLYVRTLSFNPFSDGDIYNFNTLAKLLIIAVTYFGDMTTSILLIQSYFHTNHFKNFFIDVAAIDKTLKKIGHKLDHRRDFYLNAVINLAGPVLEFSNLFMQLWNVRRGVENIPTVPLTVLYGHLYTFNLLHQGESLFVMCNVILLRRFEAINLILQKIRENLLKRIKHDKKIKIVGDFENFEDVLDVCIKCHFKLCDLRKTVAKIFGLLIITASVVQFNTVVFSFCYCYYNATIRPVSTIGWFFWAVYRIYELIRKIISAHKSTSEVKATLDWIGKLLIHCGDDMEEKLQIFALQIKHRSDPITALGLFPMDGSFAFTIIGAGATYITIIYQFQVSKLPC